MSATTTDWVRANLGAAWRHVPRESERELGELELASFQERALERGVEIARRYGGVVVADAVGLGKTRVAIGISEVLRGEAEAVAGGVQRSLVCVPARLREQWRRTLKAANCEGWEIVSHTAMSRREGVASREKLGVVVVDEAHRFRNPDAQRSEVLAEWCAEAPVVMATATPVCNTVWDLYHLMSYFLAEDDLRRVVGFDLTDAFERAERGDFDLTELVEEVVIRRVTPPEEGAFGERPSTELEVLEYRAEADEAWVWEHLEDELRELHCTAFGEEWPRELFIEYALRRWESGPEALQETLGRMREYHRRWLEARRHGRRLDRSDFRTLFRGSSDVKQEVFPFLFEEDDASEGPDRVEAVEQDLRRIRNLHERAGDVVDRRGPLGPVGELAEQLDGRLLVFTRYRRAARGLFRGLLERLGSRARAALVTGNTARATGLGRTSVDEVLRRFAPRSYGEGDLPAHQQIRVVVCTDCLSEGVNLQDCGHVVLADLPYSALVVEQRVGRLVRPGSRHQTVRVYLPRPENWSDTLGLRRRLERKMAQAERTGAGFAATGPDIWEGNATGAEKEFAAAGRSHRSSGGGGRVSGSAHPSRGARRRGPEQMGLPNEPVAPLASMTKLDALSRRLGAREGAIPDGFWRASAPVEQPVLWVAVERRRGGTSSMRWLLVRRGEPVEHRRSRLVRGLVALADADLGLEASEPPEELVERANTWVEERLAHLRAVLLAPSPIDWNAPQFEVWRQICGWFEEGAIDVSEEELHQLRTRLLRPVPTGLRRRIESLAVNDASPSVVLGRVASLVESVPSKAPVDLSVRSGVHLLPRPP